MESIMELQIIVARMITIITATIAMEVLSNVAMAATCVLKYVEDFLID